MRRRALAGVLAGPLALGLAAPACSSAEPAPGPGQIMLAIESDMAMPKDIDSIRIEVLSVGTLQFGSDYAVGPGALQLPATLAIVGGKNASDPVTLRVIGKRNHRARTIREAVTTVPVDRIATLRLAVEWICDGLVKDATASTVESSCPEGETCISGSCATSVVDSKALPTFNERDVFGGGTPSSGGVCFDTSRCFAPRVDAVVDRKDCSIAAPEGADVGGFNVALEPAGAGGDVVLSGDGICDAAGCLIPLDGDFEGGWATTLRDGRVALPKGVCAAVARGVAIHVVTSTTCATKTHQVPTCGPWSSVSTPREDKPDGGAPSRVPVPAVAGKVACPDLALQCDATTENACCWEARDGVPVYRCAPDSACSGLSNACDGNNDCLGAAGTCCLNVSTGGSCRVVCDPRVEGERCTLSPLPGEPNGCPLRKTCKTCPTRLQVSGGKLGVPICVADDRCPTPTP